MAEVYLAPGHGRRPDGRLDNGAAGGGTHEQEAGDRVARLLERRLSGVGGLRVERQPRGGPNFSGTIDIINDRGPDVSLELHHDWSGAPRGGFGFHTNADQRRLANRCHAAYKERGLTTRPHMTNLPGTSSPPAIMTRTRYLTVLWEIDRIGSNYDADEVADALAEAVLEELGISDRPATPPEDARDDPPRGSGSSDYITVGDRGDKVRSWQRDLTRLLGADALPRFGVDGDFGAETARATVRFYDRVGLSYADASRPRVGHKSRQEMEKALEADSFSFRHSDTLREGSKGAAVREWQNAVIRLMGANALPRFGADGDFGPETREATRRAFQELGLVRNPAPNPVVGPRSRAAMEDALSR